MKVTETPDRSVRNLNQATEKVRWFCSCSVFVHKKVYFDSLWADLKPFVSGLARDPIELLSTTSQFNCKTSTTRRPQVDEEISGMCGS